MVPSEGKLGGDEGTADPAADLLFLGQADGDAVHQLVKVRLTGVPRDELLEGHSGDAAGCLRVSGRP